MSEQQPEVQPQPDPVADPQPEAPADPPADPAPVVTPVDPAPEPAPDPAPAPEPDPQPEPNLSPGTDLPTTDGVPPDQIESTEPVTSDKKVFIVWDTLSLTVVSGPFVTREDAQVDLDFKAAKLSRASDAPSSLSIEAVTDGRP